MSMRDIYRQFNGATTPSDIKRLLADIQETVSKEAEKEPEDDGVEDDETSVSELQDKLNLASLGIDQLSDYLNKIQSEMDKATLPVLKASVSNGVSNYNTAYDCTTFYTKGWFSRSFMSIEGKADFAGFLIDLIKPLCQSNLETWKMIADGDPDMILFISFPREDD